MLDLLVSTIESAFQNPGQIRESARSSAIEGGHRRPMLALKQESTNRIEDALTIPYGRSVDVELWRNGTIVRAPDNKDWLSFCVRDRNANVPVRLLERLRG